MILPKYADKIKGKEQEFCPRCECKYENRNTTVIKVKMPHIQRFLFLILIKFLFKSQVVVIICIMIISLLSIYMLFLNLLEPLMNKRAKQNYQEHLDEVSNSSELSLHKIY